MYCIPIQKRIFSREEISLDDSVAELTCTQVADWTKVNLWHRGIGMMPVSKSWKTSLRDHVYAGAYFSAYLLEKPTIAIYKWPNKEQRWFLVTRNGNLIEPNEYSIWDKCLPFISAETLGFSIRVPHESISIRAINNAIWFPNHANYTHFLIDAFAPLAHLDQVYYEQIRKTYSVPLVGRQPAWQTEYMEKLSFPKGLLDDGGSRVALLLLKPESLILPLFSCKPAAYVPLRDFLIKRSSGTGEAVIPGDAGSVCVMLTRRDNRRARIKNVEQIEALVISHGGLVVDPSELSIEDRFRIIGNSSLCISEGSGTTNTLIYGLDTCKALNLTDPEALRCPGFLYGGWIYLVCQSHASEFVIGSSREELKGSPLGSVCYPVDIIERAILDGKRLAKVKMLG